MDALLEAYLDALRRRRRAPLTVRNARRALAQLDAWTAAHGVRFGELDPLSCERFFEAQLARYAVATVRHQLTTVRAAYRYAIRHELVKRDPTLDVELPRLPDVEPVTYSTEDLRAILAAVASEREELFFHLFAFTGMRLAEVASLRWEQLDLGNELIRLTGKGGKFRLVPLHPLLARVLQAHSSRGDRGPVLARRNGRPLAYNTLSIAAYTLAARAGLSGRTERRRPARLSSSLCRPVGSVLGLSRGGAGATTGLRLATARSGTSSPVSLRRTRPRCSRR